MIVLGVILFVLGWATGTSILFTLGIILIVIGVVLFFLGASGRPFAGRSHWF